MKANVIVFEAVVFILFLVFYRGASRAMGRSRNRAFFVGSVFFALAIQTAAVALGVMNFYWYSINAYYTTYPLGGYVVWLGLVPLAPCLLFYMVTAMSQMVSALMMPKAKLWSRSAVAGAVAVAFYLLVQPVAITNHWWTWNLQSFYVIDIPLVALFGVFGAVFVFMYAYELTILNPTDTKLLKRVEDKTVKRIAYKSNRHAENLTFRQLEWLFAFRLGLAYLVFGAYIGIFITVFWLVANRGQIPPGW